MKSPNKGRRFPPEPLTREEVLRLMAVCSKRAKTGVRDRALIVVLWRGQLRVSEALDLRPADFDPEACTIRVLRGKGDKTRVVIIDQQAAAVLTTWLELRDKIGLGWAHKIFCTLKGQRINTSQIREMMARRGRKAGIAKRTNPHNLRHTGASELLADGVPLLEIKSQLGHSTLATLDTYLHNLNPLARAERLRTRTW